MEMKLIAECLKLNDNEEIVDSTSDEPTLSDIESQILAVQCYCEDT